MLEEDGEDPAEWTREVVKAALKMQRSGGALVIDDGEEIVQEPPSFTLVPDEETLRREYPPRHHPEPDLPAPVEQGMSALADPEDDLDPEPPPDPDTPTLKPFDERCWRAALHRAGDECKACGGSVWA